MPSPKDPNSTVNPGPGKLPAGTVTASSLMFPSGGGSGAALTAHITDPVDAHMASAIGVNPTDPWLKPILRSAGGPMDGESVLDFVSAAIDLYPVPPNPLGYDRPVGGHTAVPQAAFPEWGYFSSSPAYVWTSPGQAITGSFVRSGAVIFTHTLVPDFPMFGTAVMSWFAPSDRGVLALYHVDNGDFAIPAEMQLVAALYLGSDVPPAGIPSANFNEYFRGYQQADYYPTNVGIDQFSLFTRYPYLNDYGGPPFTNYSANFTRYQLAMLSFYWATMASTGNVGSWLLVHWRETYATTLTAIQPAAFSANFNSTNCYSATTPDYDTGALGKLCIHNVFIDPLTASPVSAGETLTNDGGSVSYLSGVAYYNNGLTKTHWDFDVRADGLFANSFYPGKTPSVPDLPSGFESSKAPLTIDFSDFGADRLDERTYYNLRATGSGSTFGVANPPSPATQAQFLATNVQIPYYYTVPPHAPVGGWGKPKFIWAKPFSTDTQVEGTTRYLFNSHQQNYVGTQATETFEPFVDERFRYSSTYVPSTPVTTEPSVLNRFSYWATFTSGGSDLQVIGHQCVYPKTDFSTGYKPVGPNYATVYAGDSAGNTRFFMRAFETSVARNTGRIRIKGLPSSSFASTGTWTGDVVADHPGGVALCVRVPGSTVWLDLGRAKGNPSSDVSIDLTGCQIGIEEIGTNEYIITYDTTAFTAYGGAAWYGDSFAVFFAIVIMKGAGDTNIVEEVEWLAP